MSSAPTEDLLGSVREYSYMRQACLVLGKSASFQRLSDRQLQVYGALFFTSLLLLRRLVHSETRVRVICRESGGA